MQNIAEKIISKFGGAYRLAEVTGVDVSQVYRWAYPKEKGGTGGTIPARHFTTILKGAEKKNIDLSLEELVGLKKRTNKQ